MACSAALSKAVTFFLFYEFLIRLAKGLNDSGEHYFISKLLGVLLFAFCIWEE